MVLVLEAVTLKMVAIKVVENYEDGKASRGGVGRSIMSVWVGVQNKSHKE